MIDLRRIAVALEGEISGRQVLAPGPHHSPHDRSLAVCLSPDAPDGFMCFSHAGDDWRECRDYVRARLGLPEWQARDEHDRRAPPSRVNEFDRDAVDRETENYRPYTEDDLVRIARAAKLWDEAQVPRGTAAERYLNSRALELQPDLAGSVLRFHRRCPWRNENTGKTERIPALLAGFRSIENNEITAVHRIRVDQPERWPKADRRMLGIVRGAAIKLDTIEHDALVIGEGLETSMAARQLGYRATWALGSVGAIAFFPVLEDVKTLTILGETGKASEDAIKMCGRRWSRARRHVRIAYSEIGSDINDAIMLGISR
jgi:putative DNA primase/helicase